MAGVVVSLALGSVLAGCGDDVEVERFRVSEIGRSECRDLLDSLPGTLAGERRRTTTGSAYAAAWGDPAIVLRCGAALPDDFATQPCVTRDGIGWSVPADQADGGGDEVVLTLAFREPVVQVRVPASYRPNGAADAMADLDATVRAHTVANGECQ